MPCDHFEDVNTAHIPDPMPVRYVSTAQLKSLHDALLILH